MIQELQAKRAEDREEIKALELKMKKKDGDYSAAKREALGATETVKRMKD